MNESSGAAITGGEMLNIGEVKAKELYKAIYDKATKEYKDCIVEFKEEICGQFISWEITVSFNSDTEIGG